jgi:Domain of unknown function (DUF5004)
MKNVIKIFFPVLLMAGLFSACRPDKLEDIGTPRNNVATFAGTWKLTKVTQKDEEAARKAFPYAELDLTTLFPYTDFTLKLDVDSKLLPNTFTTTPGNSPKIITLTSGQWSVDNAQQPTVITFKNGAVTELVTLGGYPVGSNKNLKFKVERRDVDTATHNKLLISYTYEFTKQ